jgi:hypothetical protein
VTSKPVESKPAPKAVAAKSAEAKPNVIRQAAARPPFKPSATTDATSAAAPAPAPQQTALVAGSAPIMSTNSFDSRFSAVK